MKDMKCETCGNEYDKAFEVIMDGERHVYDSFECAAHALAPRCTHCGVMILGHGAESEGAIYCCANCAHAEGVMQTKDRV